jgi:parallel beta-helix repeat protein
MLPIVVPEPPHLNIPQKQTTYTTQNILFVDNQMPQNECREYEIISRNCSGGSERAFNTIKGALEVCGQGDTVAIRQGRYIEPVAPLQSGVADAPITIRSYNSEKVVIYGLNQPAINLNNRYYIIIQDLIIDSTLGWGRLEESAYNTIRQNIFYRAQARGTTGGLKLVRSHYNKIEENRFEHGNDSVVLQESDRNIIAGNIFVWGRHSLLSIRCSNFNVIRGNRFHNERQKAMEIFDCEGVSDAPFLLNATKRNLIENNNFIYTRGPSRPHKYNAIQYAGQLGIVRRNFFYDNQGGGINVQIYPQEALFNYGHRIYHNTFYYNKCYGFNGSKLDNERYGDIIVKNNLFYLNLDCHSNRKQIGDFSPFAIDLDSNGIIDKDVDPQFVSPELRNLRLKRTSPMIDQGAFLTKTTAAGTGNLLPVEDVKYFYDGFAINNETGDLVQLAGSVQQAIIISINYDDRVLELDRSLSWKINQGVALAFDGKSPDLGAHESINPKPN